MCRYKRQTVNPFPMFYRDRQLRKLNEGEVGLSFKCSAYLTSIPKNDNFSDLVEYSIKTSNAEESPVYFKSFRPGECSNTIFSILSISRFG